jgi:hypothetical protein
VLDHRAAPATSGSAQRTVGYVMSAVGVVALAAGGFFGYRAYSENKRSKGECRAAGNADPKQASVAPFGLQLSGVW